MIVAIEGADGAGKATVAGNLVGRLTDAGRSAALMSFPRYGETAGGYALGEFLSGRLPRAVTPEAAAVLYALDRMESRDLIRAAASGHDFVVMDRYIASNIAYQAAKVDPAAAEGMIGWIVELETSVFRLPAPDLSIYLDTPAEVSRDLIARKQARAYTERSYDEHEQDERLQRRVRSMYSVMAERGVLGPWATVRTVTGDRLRSAEDIAGEVAAAVFRAAASGGAPEPGGIAGV
jgi:dTMP kinase